MTPNSILYLIMSTGITLVLAGLVNGMFRKQREQTKLINEHEYSKRAMEKDITDLEKRIIRLEAWEDRHIFESNEIRQNIFDGLKDLKNEVQIVIQMLKSDFKELSNRVDKLDICIENICKDK